MEKTIHLTLFLMLILLLTDLFFLRVNAVETFSDGFESGDFSAWTGTFGTSAPTITNSTAHHGSRSCIEDIVDVWGFGGTYKNFGLQSTVYARFYVNITSIIIGSEKDIQGPYLSMGSGAGDRNGRLVSLWIKNDSGTCKWELEYKNGGSFFKTVSAITVETSAWICVEMKCAVSTTVGEARLYLDGNEAVTQTGLNNGSTRLYQFDLIYYGSGNGTATIRNDCVAVADTYIGPEDMTGPTFQNFIPSSTTAGTMSLFSCLVADDANASSYIFSTNNTEVWVNDTATVFSGFFNATSGWANVTKTLNDTIYNVVSYIWYANDTSNNWSHSDQYNLTLSSPVYTLTTSVVGSGSLYLNNSGPYYYGDVVELTAAPTAGWSFDHWSGDLSGSANPTTILINGNKTVEANFTQNVYTLTISVIGSGSVDRNNSGPYYYGDTVELTAVPSTGWSFQSWSGDLIGSTNPGTILIDGNKSVTATFTQNTYTLTISIDGSGSLDRNNSGPYHYGDVVELTAVPSIGWTFDHWSGDLSGSSDPATILVDGNKSVTANFTQNTYNLIVLVDPDGSGSVNLNNSGPYHYADVVELTAVPAAGWSFDHWTGDLTGSTNPSTILVDGNKDVNATFTQIVYMLDTSVVGNGIVSLNNTGPYHYGDIVELTAVPNVGWTFDHWSGDITGFSNPDTIAVTGDKAVTAHFTELVVENHDVGLTNATSYRRVVGEGFVNNITVTVQNHGDFPETFNVTIRLNATDIGTKEVTVQNGSSTSVIFEWNSTGFAYANCTLSAYAWPVENETDIEDNTFIDGKLAVSIPGDLNCDGTVDILDAILLSNAFDTSPVDSHWNPDADINGDGIVDILDAIVLSNHFLMPYL